LLLVLASGEFLLTIYYHHRWIALERNIPEEFQRIYYGSAVWSDTRWLGIRSEQAPTDNWSMQEIISEIRPDYVIEAGTMNGGTTLFYASVLSNVNPDGKVITIDIKPQVEQASQLSLWKKHVELIVGSSTDPNVADHIAHEVQGKKVLVTLDSLHTRDHVLREMQIYSKLVTRGSYLVVQDTVLNGHPIGPHWGPGPMEAVRDFLKANNDFVVDSSREKFLLTFYPAGWLKRVK
jgi:cephalosporin hydroxylase